MKLPMIVAQCWDDGVTTDARLADILRRYGARASFNLNAGLYEAHRRPGWRYRGTQVSWLGWNEMRSVYDGFTIANHSLQHPHLDQIPVEAARREIQEGRDRLEQFFGRPVRGFAYPFGTYNETVKALLRETGHGYARTVGSVPHPFPPSDPMEFHPSCHFLAPDFWARYEKAKSGGVFYFWGHSYEMIAEEQWAAFERTIARIGADPESRWGDLPELFEASKPGGRASAL